jgi:hypothetical protein
MAGVNTSSLLVYYFPEKVVSGQLYGRRLIILDLFPSWMGRQFILFTMNNYFAMDLLFLLVTLPLAPLLVDLENVLFTIPYLENPYSDHGTPKEVMHYPCNGVPAAHTQPSGSMGQVAVSSQQQSI